MIREVGSVYRRLRLSHVVGRHLLTATTAVADPQTLDQK